MEDTELRPQRSPIAKDQGVIKRFSDTTSRPGLLVKSGKGRPRTDLAEAMKQNKQHLLQTIREIRLRVDFKMSLRGWCYMLENEWGLRKDHFDNAQGIINDFRINGDLPIDFVLGDEARQFGCLESITDESPEEYVQGWLDYLHKVVHLNYEGLSFWEAKKYYIQMLVEKVDLVSLFEPICQKYHIPIATARGNASLLQRKDLMERFREHEEEGRRPILLYCGDHDPSGLQISDNLYNNIAKLRRAIGWYPHHLIIDRFGLNFDFIKKYGLSWVNNLITASGENLGDRKHSDHYKPYVQDYIREYGERKVEANAIVIRPDMGRKLCLNTINKYIPASAIEEFEKQTEKLQNKVKRIIKKKLK